MSRYFDRENRGKWDWGGLEIKRKLNRRPSEKEAIEQRRLWDPDRRRKILEWELKRMHAKEAADEQEARRKSEGHEGADGEDPQARGL